MSAQSKAGWLDVVQVPLKLPRLDPAFSGLRIAQLSDIHLGGWMSQARLAHVVDVTLAQAPDLVVFTGDYLCELTDPAQRSIPLQGLVSQLGRISPAIPTFTVMGNHDYWIDPISLRRFFIEIGITELSNDVHTFRRGNAKLHLCGIDNFTERRDDLKTVLKKLPDKGAAILLVHEPDFAELSAASGRFDLQLSGHSHGGQIVFPGWGIFASPYLSRKYPSGWYQLNGMQLYTSRGTGMGILALRLNCRPEVTIFTLQPV